MATSSTAQIWAAPESAPYEEPRNATERALAEIWSQVFDGKRVGRSDNYFALGGNSLLALKIMEQVSVRLDAPLPVVVLFQFPTVGELAEVLESVQTEGAASADGTDPS